MSTLTFLGSGLVLVPLIIVTALAWWRWRGDWVAAKLLGAAYIGAALIFNAVKRLVHRARPPEDLHLMHAGGFAFPSGHATQAAAVWFTLAFLGSRTASSRAGRTAFWLAGGFVAAAVGLTRLYLRVHWLTDVVAGWAAGVIWAGLMLAVYGSVATGRSGSASIQG